MKAYQLTAYNNDAKIQEAEVSQPAPSAGQVLVKIADAGLNPLDNMIARGDFKQLIPYQLLGRRQGICPSLHQ